jgi:DNA modification methylase
MPKVNELKKYHKNPRRLSEKQFELLKRDLEELGDLSGVVHDINSNEIIGGNQRSIVFEDAEIILTEEFDKPTKTGTIALGYIIYKKEKYAYRKVKWTKKQAEKANIVANKAGGSWDFDILANEFELPDLLDWGFEENELIGLNFTDEIDTEKLDDAPGLQKEAVSRIGDLFMIDGKHRVMCGNSTKIDDIEKLMNGEKADILFTDPPYEIEETSIYQPINLLSENTNILIMCADKQMQFIFESINAEFKRLYILDTNIASPTNNDVYVNHIALLRFKKGNATKFNNIHNGGRSIIKIDYRKNLKEDKLHNHQKSVKLFELFINYWSNENQLLVDLFLGSGSSLIACEQTKRKCCGMELNPNFIDVILKRYHNLYPDKKIDCLNRTFDFKKLFK